MAHPADDGFFLPPDWTPHSRCWMAWPCRAEAWGEHMDAARDTYAEVANTIARFEPVTMITKPKNVAEASLQLEANVRNFSLPHDDSWLRDNGPTFVTNRAGQVAGVDWLWNAWGERYSDHDRDAAVAEAVLAHIAMRRYEAPLVLEGGAIHGDGEGTLLASEGSLLNPNRNSGKSRAEIEQILTASLGVRQVVWLGKGLLDDMSGGHVDNLACFLRPGVVLALTSSEATDGNYAALKDNVERLRAVKDAAGRSLEIIEIEQPRARYTQDGRRLCLSYISMYLANGAAIIPAFEDPQDAKASEIIARAFPDREVVQIPATELAFGGGGIHSITLGQPAGAPA
ncbi:MAG: agmatine deiminase family protein [Dongiaceae bacterium]